MFQGPRDQASGLRAGPSQKGPGDQASRAKNARMKSLYGPSDARRQTIDSGSISVWGSDSDSELGLRAVVGEATKVGARGLIPEAWMPGLAVSRAAADPACIPGPALRPEARSLRPVIVRPQ